MGLPGIPTEHEISEAIELAREAITAVENDEESWFDRLMKCADDGGHPNDNPYHSALFVMMQELTRTRGIVMTARAESKLNVYCSAALRLAVDDYENT